MNIKCCGAGRRTRFCPDCGKEIVANLKIESLIDYLESCRDSARHQAECHESTARSLEERGRDGHDRLESAKARRSHEATMSRWITLVESMRDELACSVPL